MKVEKRKHPIVSEREKSSYKIPKIIGDFQYIYSSKKGKISLIKLLNYFRNGQDFYEIYCLEGNLFEDVERFTLKKEAKIRIKELLED